MKRMLITIKNNRRLIVFLLTMILLLVLVVMISDYMIREIEARVPTVGDRYLATGILWSVFCKW